MSYRGAGVVFSSLYIGVRTCGVLLVKRNYFTIDLSLQVFFKLASYSYKAHRKVWRALKRTRASV